MLSSFWLPESQAVAHRFFPFDSRRRLRDDLDTRERVVKDLSMLRVKQTHTHAHKPMHKVILCVYLLPSGLLSLASFTKFQIIVEREEEHLDEYTSRSLLPWISKSSATSGNSRKVVEGGARGERFSSVALFRWPDSRMVLQPPARVFLAISC